MAGNALAARRMAPSRADVGSQEQSDPEAEMERLMKETGYQGSDPAEGMKHVWSKMPTDGVAELIEMLAQKHGLPTPWDGKEGGMMKLGGPDGGGDRPEFSDQKLNDASFDLARRGDPLGRLYSRTNEPPEMHGEVMPFGPNRYGNTENLNAGIIKPLERYQAIRNSLKDHRR